MAKLLFIFFRVTNSRLKNNNSSLRVTNSMVDFLFFHFRVTDMKLINEKNPLQFKCPETPRNRYLSLDF